MEALEGRKNISFKCILKEEVEPLEEGIRTDKN